MAQEQTKIDTLLEHYLNLLHEYTTLRSELNSLQTGIYQSIARANFSAERGVWYGRDFYDERMQASRLVSTSLSPLTLRDEGEDDKEAREKAMGSDQNIPTFRVVNAKEAADAARADQEESRDEHPDGSEDATDDTSAPPEERDTSTIDADAKATAPDSDTTSPRTATRKDPLRWFGLMAPTSLRQAQGHSIRAVEDVIPRLCSVNAEMAYVEIEVRRARKRRGKAEAAAAAAKGETGERAEVAVGS
ncbi:hypothetical protein F5Y18DRAFT_428493 [Xylariaceae sp. FL1019]|nr:hypothetical protein F5Y18DRAFT_428493 [Xylariaceae sp. FL1019]